MKRSNEEQYGLFNEGLSKLPGVLEHLGFSALRKGQDEAVINLLRGKDTIALLPTGHGKSAIYIVPTLAHQWRTLIFSPLIALMNDQVNSLQARGQSAAQINSALSDAERRYNLQQWMSGQLQFLFVAPERLGVDQFQKGMLQQRPDMVVIDESHMVSEWGDSFRPAYKQIAKFIDDTVPATTLALTATATPMVVDDIQRSFRMENSDIVSYLPRRENLHMSGQDFVSMADFSAQINQLAPSGSVIVYCATRKQVEGTFEELKCYTNRTIAYYHGGMKQADREASMKAFMENRSEILVATNAFGMGVDKPDVRGVFHRDCPPSMEALTQEAGRAGRDGQDSYCKVFHDRNIWNTHSFLLELSFPKPETVRRVWDGLTDLRNGQQILTMTVDDIAMRMRMRSDDVQGSLGILASNGVIKREQANGDIGKFKILREPHDANGQRMIQLLRGNGQVINGDHNRIDISMAHLAGLLNVNKTTAAKNAKGMMEAGFLTYIPPFRGKSTNFLGDISDVDFNRLRMKREEGFSRMNDVQRYLQVPDEEKPAFIESYFETGETEEV